MIRLTHAGGCSSEDEQVGGERQEERRRFQSIYFLYRNVGSHVFIANNLFYRLLCSESFGEEIGRQCLLVPGVLLLSSVQVLTLLLTP